MDDQTLRVGRARRVCASLIGVAALAAPLALAAPAHATPVSIISGHITVAQPILDQTVNFGGITGFGVAACQGVAPGNVIPTNTSPCPTTSAAGQGANASGDFSFTVGDPDDTHSGDWHVRPYWNSIAVGPAINLGSVTGDISVNFSVGLGDVSTFTGTVTPPPSEPGAQPIQMGVAACPDGYGQPGLFTCQRSFSRVSLPGGGPYTLYVPPSPSYRLVALMGGVSVGAVQGPLAPPANVNFTVTNADLGTVSGTVTMSNSDPLPYQFSIRACLVVGGLPPCLIAQSVNLQPGGAYLIRLPAPAGGMTTWDLAPTALGGGSNLSAPVRLTVGPGSSTANTNFVIDVAVFGAVTGEVTLTGGSPPGALSAVRVAACPAGFPPQFYAFCQPFASPDAGGTYQVNLVPPGSHTLVAIAAGQVLQVAPAPTSVVGGATATGPNFTVDLSGFALLSADVDVGGQTVVSRGVAVCAYPYVPGLSGCTGGPPITVVDAPGGQVSTPLAPGSWNVVGFAQTSPGIYVGTPPVRVDLVAGSSVACTFTVSTSTSSACGPGEVIQVVTDGGVVTTDPGGDGATPEIQVQTEIDVPSGISGQFSITPQPAGPSPTGFVLFDTEMVLTAPGSATVSAPYVATFTIDASALGDVAPADVQVFRDDAPVEDCTVAGQADPDPCVAQRDTGAGGDAVITVRTTQFSTWSFGGLLYTFAGFYSPVDNLPTLNSVKAGSAVPVKFGLGGDRGLDIFAAGYPKSQDIACSSTASVDGIESTVNPESSELTYDAGSGRYSYVWKTDKIWAAGSCRQLVLRFRDGSEARANFKLK